MLYANDDYGQGLARNFVAALRAAGGGVASMDPFLDDTEDFTPYLRRMQRLPERVPLVERATVEQIHQQIDVPVGSQPAVERAHDVRVRERAQDRDLAEGPLRLIAGRHRLARELERDPLRVARNLDLVHAGEGSDAQHLHDPDATSVNVTRLQIERHRRAPMWTLSRPLPDRHPL